MFDFWNETIGVEILKTTTVVFCFHFQFLEKQGWSFFLKKLKNSFSTFSLHFLSPIVSLLSSSPFSLYFPSRLSLSTFSLYSLSPLFSLTLYLFYIISLHFLHLLSPLIALSMFSLYFLILHFLFLLSHFALSLDTISTFSYFFHLLLSTLISPPLSLSISHSTCSWLA